MDELRFFLDIENLRFLWLETEIHKDAEQDHQEKHCQSERFRFEIAALPTGGRVAFWLFGYTAPVTSAAVDCGKEGVTCTGNKTEKMFISVKKISTFCPECDILNLYADYYC